MNKREANQLLKLLNYSESENARKRKILNEFNN